MLSVSFNLDAFRFFILVLREVLDAVVDEGVELERRARLGTYGTG
jgi:hypothetical protein